MKRFILTFLASSLSVFTLVANRDSSGAEGVAFISMSAIPSQVVVHLKWEVGSEEEGVQYILEKSVDGITWSEKARRLSVGDNSTYQVYLESLINFPERSVEIFRLRIIDAEGNSSILDQTIVKHPVLSEIRLIADQKNVYNTVTLTFEALEKTKTMITVWDISGQVRYFKRHQCELGYNRRLLPVSNLEPGIYSVVVDDEKGNRISKQLLIHKRVGKR
jgi:hypothetical protein